MSTDISNTIALLALVISLASFLLSYRANRLAKAVAAAEKRTQAHAILHSTLIEAEELLSIVRVGSNYQGTDISIPKGLDTIESQLVTMIKNIQERLEWLREKDSDDPILLEEYKSLALEVGSKVNQAGHMIRELRIDVKGPPHKK